MNASTKTFFASLIIFACSLGFFIGAFAFNNAGSAFCPNGRICAFQPEDCYKRNLDYRMRHGEGFSEGPHHKDNRFNRKFDFKKDMDFMDSVLQVTHEQKAALEQQRHMMDSTFKELRKQKIEAEKTLREALDSNDDKKIAAAKANILKAQEGLLNHRIDGVKGLNKILTKEQQDKFKFLQFERMKKQHEKDRH